MRTPTGRLETVVICDRPVLAGAPLTSTAGRARSARVHPTPVKKAVGGSRCSRALSVISSTCNPPMGCTSRNPDAKRKDDHVPTRSPPRRSREHHQQRPYHQRYDPLSVAPTAPEPLARPARLDLPGRPETSGSFPRPRTSRAASSGLRVISSPNRFPGHALKVSQWCHDLLDLIRRGPFHAYLFFHNHRIAARTCESSIRFVKFVGWGAPGCKPDPFVDGWPVPDEPPGRALTPRSRPRPRQRVSS